MSERQLPLGGERYVGGCVSKTEEVACYCILHTTFVLSSDVFRSEMRFCVSGHVFSFALAPTYGDSPEL